MDKYGIALFIFIAGTTISAASAQSCKACNCQFHNIQVLDQLVENRVKSTLADEPCKLIVITIILQCHMTLFN